MPRNWRMIAAGTSLAILSLSAMARASEGHRSRPLVSEFGTGPRRSHGGHYVASLESAAPLAVGPIQTVRLRLTDTTGTPVEGVSIAIRGGMPAHHHGLPTAPRVTGSAGPGLYQIEGLKFSMRAWWKLEFQLDGPAGRDSVYFGLEV